MLSNLHRFHGINSLNHTYKRGQTVRSPQLALRYAVNKHRSSYRAAVVVSRKVDKSAVVRNRIRRRVYDAIRANADAITEPYDLVFTVFSSQLADLETVKLQQLVHGQLRRAGVLANGRNRPVHGIVNTKD